MAIKNIAANSSDCHGNIIIEFFQISQIENINLTIDYTKKGVQTSDDLGGEPEWMNYDPVLDMQEINREENDQQIDELLQQALQEALPMAGKKCN